jgi:hypothetical protein
MPRRKIQMGLIGKAGSRTRTFKQRKIGLQKKAFELAELCDVDVAVVVGADPGGGAPEVWEFGSAGVVDRYRRLPADRRAKHTHLGYLSAELDKEKAKLARERQQGPKALAPPAQKSLDGVDLEELLGSIDAALLATAQRRKALGMPEDDGGQLRQVAPDAGAPLVGDGFDDDMDAWVDELTWHGVVESQPLNANMMQQPAPGVQYINGVEPRPLNAGMMQQPAPGVQYINGVEPRPLNACMMQPAPGFQYINGGSLDMGLASSTSMAFPQQMRANGDNDHGQLRNTLLCPDYGFQYTDSNDGCLQMPMLSYGNAYDGCWFNQAMNPSLDITCNPVHTPLEYSSTATTGDCFTGVSAIGPDDGSFMDAGGYEYGTQCLADYFQCPDASQQLGVEPLHYFSDVAKGVCYYDLDEAGSCSSGSGRSQLFAQSHSSSGTLQFCSEQYQQSDVRVQASGVQEFWVR